MVRAVGNWTGGAGFQLFLSKNILVKFVKFDEITLKILSESQDVAIKLKWLVNALSLQFRQTACHCAIQSLKGFQWEKPSLADR